MDQQTQRNSVIANRRLVLRNAHDDFLSGLPSDWDCRPISDVGSVHSGTTPSRSNPNFWNGDIPWVTPGELTGRGEKYLRQTAERITRQGVAASSISILPENTLVVTTRATLGLVALAGMPLTTNQGFKSIVLGSEASPHFFYHLFGRLKGELVRRASGTTFLEISGKQFGAVEVPVPPLPEQRRIAEILDTLDAAIRRTEQVIAKLRQMKQGLLHDLLTRGLDDNGELRDPHRHPEQFQDSPLGRIPRAWETNILDSLTEPGSPITYGVVQPGPHVADGVLFVRGGDFPEGTIRIPELRTISKQVDAQYSRTRLMGGEVLVSLVGQPGSSAVVPIQLAGANIARQAAMVRLNSRFDPHFLRAYIASSSGQRALLGDTLGTVQRVVNLRDLRNLIIPIPLPDEQAAIISSLRAIDACIDKEVKALFKLSLVKHGLMDDLLTGRVRVSIPEEATP